jgi:hypothetical protein
MQDINVQLVSHSFEVFFTFLANIQTVARTPSKLVNMLLAKGVSQALIDSNLQIIEGNALDVNAVKQTLQIQGKPVTKILSGLGMSPKEALSGGSGPESRVCQETTASILKALEELDSVEKPFFTVISTTGISDGPRDLPLVISPMYHMLLATPHKDKKVMEKLIQDASATDRSFGGYCIVRSAWLTDGKSKGMDKIRDGVEEKPAVGYSISRADVGLWIFESILRGNASKYNGKKVTVTH